METKVCKKCGIEKSVDEFYTNRSHCKKCEKERHRKYRAENRDKLNERHRKYVAENRDKVNELVRKWQAENRDKLKEYQRKYYAENSDKLNERHRKWQAENRDKVNEQCRKYYAKNRKRDFIAALIADGTPPEQAQIKWEVELAFSGPEQGGECETWRELMMMGIF